MSKSMSRVPRRNSDAWWIHCLMWLAFPVSSFADFRLNRQPPRTFYPQSCSGLNREPRPQLCCHSVKAKSETGFLRPSRVYCVITIVITKHLKPKIKPKNALYEGTHPPPASDLHRTLRMDVPSAEAPVYAGMRFFTTLRFVQNDIWSMAYPAHLLRFRAPLS